MAVFTNDWHARHDSVWRSVVLPLLPQAPRRWIELGSYEGQSAIWTLSNAIRDCDELVCCDIWPDPVVHQRFKDNTRSHRVTIVSEDATAWMVEQAHLRQHASVVYVDANHHARPVLEQGVLAWRLLPVGGLLILDDCRWEHPDAVSGRLPPGLAINALVRCLACESTLLHLGACAILQKRVAI